LILHDFANRVCDAGRLRKLLIQLLVKGSFYESLNRDMAAVNFNFCQNIEEMVLRKKVLDSLLVAGPGSCSEVYHMLQLEKTSRNCFGTVDNTHGLIGAKIEEKNVYPWDSTYIDKLHIFINLANFKIVPVFLGSKTSIA
ncbi:hypothetical protein ACH5RR_029741, partial [Cinchona calisaya]